MPVNFVNANTPTHAAAASFSGGMNVNATGPNHIAIVPVTFDSLTGLSVVNISLGGVPMDACGPVVQSPSAGGNFACGQWFRLINPPSGSPNLFVSVPGAAEIYVSLDVFSDVDAATPILNYTTATTNGTTTGDLVIASTVNQITVSLAGDVGGVIFTGTNQTLTGAIDTGGGNSMGCDRCTTPGASITHTWTAEANCNFVLAGFSLQEIQTRPPMRRVGIAAGKQIGIPVRTGGGGSIYG